MSIPSNSESTERRARLVNIPEDLYESIRQSEIEEHSIRGENEPQAPRTEPPD